MITPTREERELNGTQIKEIVLDDNESPLNVLMHTPCVRGTIIFQIRKCAPQMIANRKARKKLDAHRRTHESMGMTTATSQMMSGSVNEYDLTTPLSSLHGINRSPNVPSMLNRSSTLPPKAAILRQIHAKSVNLSGANKEPVNSELPSNYDNVERRRHLARTESLNRTYLSRRNSSLQNYLMLNTRLPCLVELAQGKVAVYWGLCVPGFR